MKFGLFGGAKSSGEGSVGDSLGYRKYIDYVLYAEELGYHSVFVVEHHFTGVGQLSASLNFLSYLAGRTQRIRLGTAVVVLPWHNPVLLAEQVATLDLLSNGRFDFGVGKGYRQPEFSGFCIPSRRPPSASTKPWHSCARPGPPATASHTTGSAGTSTTSSSSPALCSGRIHRSGWGPAASSRSGVRRRRAIISCSTRSRPSI